MNPALEREVRARAQELCEYCRMPQECDPLPFQIDHIIAIKHRGSTVAHNLALACFACNNHKGANLSGIDPDTGEIVPLFNPRRQRWVRHFRWHGPLLVGRTKSGRATIAVLEINLPHRVRHRQGLMDEGVFPASRRARR